MKLKAVRPGRPRPHPIWIASDYLKRVAEYARRESGSAERRGYEDIPSER